MLTLQIVEGHNQVRIATVQKKGIRYRGRLHLPVSMGRLDGGATDPTGSLGGAALGAMTFGAAGATCRGGICGTRTGAEVIRADARHAVIHKLAERSVDGVFREAERVLCSPLREKYFAIIASVVQPDDLHEQFDGVAA